LNDFKQIFSPVLFALLLICFSLPFFNLTCDNQKIATVTGFDLMGGTAITPPQLSQASSHPEEVSPEPLAIISFSAAGIAFFLSFFKKGALPVIALSVIGAATLLLLSSKLDNDISGRIEMQQVTVEWAIGIYLVLFIFIITGLLNAYMAYDNRYKEVDLEEYTQKMKVCFNCGTANDRSNIYCNKCGSALG
jgi:ribosomal protein S27AE